ncbi:MAG: hypothetical protein JW995_11325 [Melioribacteraceae bacterium]|nr:hypothetical protein [Melioribacteraceae bacterium]
MKIKIISVIILLLLFVNVFHAQSDHKNFDFNCSLCHECENPTKIDPCLKSCPRHEIITVHHTAQQGPKEIILNKFEGIEDIFEPVNFSHRAHSEMSSMAGGCEMCHHYNPPGSIKKCSDCHETNRMRTDLSKPDLKGAFHRQCIDCHSIWDNDVKCADCHAENATEGAQSATKESYAESYHQPVVEPGRIVYETEEMDGVVTFYHNDHVNVFGLQCNSCHKSESCARCHMENNVLADANRDLEEKHAVCSSCHDVDNDCESCHKEKIVEGFNHARSTGFNLNEYHGSVECEDCHKAGKGFKGLKSECSSCHKDWNSSNFDHSVTGLMLDEIHIENDCADCHTEGVYTSQNCENCHDPDIKYPDSKPGTLKKR